MKKLMTTLVLLLAIATGGAWYAYQYGYRLPDRPDWHKGLIAPVAISDPVASYSLIQKYQIERPDRPFPDGKAETNEWVAHSEDKSFVPHGLRYVRVEYLASQVEKPYPKIFFAEQDFPTDIWTLEDVVVVKPGTMVKILSSAESLSCEPNSGVQTERTDQVEVLMRSADKQLKRCLLNSSSGCQYLNRLHQLARELNDTRGFDPELEQRMKCSAFLRPWQRYVSFRS